MPNRAGARLLLQEGAAVFRPDLDRAGHSACAESKPLRTPPRCHQAAGGSWEVGNAEAERWAEKGDAGWGARR